MALDPLDMSPDELQGKLINAGLRLARTEGLGLPLVNALREQFPDIGQAEIGQAVTTIGSGVSAAQIAGQGPATEPIGLDILPVLPSTFFSGDEIDRVKAFGDVSFEAVDPSDPSAAAVNKTWDVRVDCGEGITFQELIDCIESHFQGYAEESPAFPMQNIVNRYINVYFMGKRF